VPIITSIERLDWRLIPSAQWPKRPSSPEAPSTATSATTSAKPKWPSTHCWSAPCRYGGGGHRQRRAYALDRVRSLDHRYRNAPRARSVVDRSHGCGDLHTVRISIRSHIFLAMEPFLVVGLIASIRRVLIISLQMTTLARQGGWSAESASIFHASMIELALLVILIPVLVFSITLLRRHALRNLWRACVSGAAYTPRAPEPSRAVGVFR